MIPLDLLVLIIQNFEPVVVSWKFLIVTFFGTRIGVLTIDQYRKEDVGWENLADSLIYSGTLWHKFTILPCHN